MSKDHPIYIYKITSLELWENAKNTGILKGMPIDIADGYMHFSTKEQLSNTLRLHFKGQGELVILGVNTEGLNSSLKWEVSRGGALFPHLYAELKTTMIDFVKIIKIDKNGETNLGELK